MIQKERKWFMRFDGHSCVLDISKKDAFDSCKKLRADSSTLTIDFNHK